MIKSIHSQSKKIRTKNIALHQCRRDIATAGALRVDAYRFVATHETTTTATKLVNSRALLSRRRRALSSRHDASSSRRICFIVCCYISNSPKKKNTFKYMRQRTIIRWEIMRATVSPDWHRCPRRGSLPPGSQGASTLPAASSIAPSTARTAFARSGRRGRQPTA